MECKIVVEKDINNKLEDLSQNLNSKTHSLSSLSQQVGAVSSTVDNLESRIKAVEESINNQKTDEAIVKQSVINYESGRLSKNLIISGIPINDNEDLKKVLKDIALKLNIVLINKNIKKIIRLKSNKQGNTLNPPPILVSFHEVKIKQDLLDGYFQRIKDKNYITTGQINLQPDTRIYLNIQLPRLLQQVHSRIIELKKDRLIESFIVKPAAIKVKRGGNWHFIRSAEDINKLITMDV